MPTHYDKIPGMNCPLCRRPTTWKANPWRPFCSERCQLTDLGTWAAEEYRVPGPNLTMELPSEPSGESTQEAGQQVGKNTQI
ncbi:MAG: DNA gyrase inhibitor YacG [Nitrospira sp.]|nr:DNA gyrase inhibitor YacG [Nitrospira sp.]